ncbi:MAG TPA: type II toxin-antitoxin system CcdA family antitoxin [Streptosporangiaceae bacterium]|jgi:post-segregation antitoxin (ccd killing protein)
MAKRKITVTVDEELVDLAHAVGDEKLSAVVNTALAEHVERLGRLATLRQLLDRWETQAGPLPPDVLADAAAAFDEAEDSPRMAAG